MPIRKFANVDAMKTPRWRPPGDPEIARVFAGLLEIGNRTDPRRFPPGVHKYGSIEDMQRALDRWAAPSRAPGSD